MLQQSSSSSVAEDNEEKDRFLKQVEARDLIEFGMIPVSVIELSSGFNIFIFVGEADTRILIRL